LELDYLGASPAVLTTLAHFSVSSNEKCSVFSRRTDHRRPAEFGKSRSDQGSAENGANL
jgi:hypothetical protein